MIRSEPRNRKLISSRNGLNIFTPLKNRRQINRVSQSQKVKNVNWKETTDQRFIMVGEICEWCLKPAKREEIDGHHIIPRRFNNHSLSNCFCCHRWVCHAEITDNNIDVSKYPNKIAWENNNGQ